MSEAIAELLPSCAAFEPGGNFDEFLKTVPAKWVVYLMADEMDRPVQLLCVKNLRYSLKRRLGTEEESAGPSRRVDYRQIVRRVYWRRVYSAFEADAVYLEAARASFPRSYRGMLGFQFAWFVHVDPEAKFPRYTKTIDLNARPGQLIGPIEDKHAAARLIENVTDWFDLCRYYNILTEAPRGTACAYKEMGKCPAPCDGSISMESYRQVVRWSVESIVDPSELIRQGAERMKRAAAELRFESAGKIKQYLDSLGQLGKGPFRHARRLRDFNFLSIQPGPRASTAKAFLITPGRIEEVAGLVGPPEHPGGILRLALELAQERGADGVDAIGAERVGVVAQHLFAAAKSASGVFLPLESADEKAILKAFREVQKQKTVEEAPETEGVVKELQAL